MWPFRSPKQILAHQNSRQAITDLKCRIRRKFEVLSHPEQVLFLVWWLQAEVENGTIHQYLSNSTGNDFHLAAEALSEIGATKARLALDEVKRWFPEGGPQKDRWERVATLEQCAEANPAEFEKEIRDINNRLDNAFPEANDLLVAYLRKHVDSLK